MGDRDLVLDDRRDLAAVGRVVAQALDGRVKAAELVLGREPDEQMARSGGVEVPVDAEVDPGPAGLLEQWLGLVVDRLVRLADRDARPAADLDRLTVGGRLPDRVVADVRGVDPTVLGDDLGELDQLVGRRVRRRLVVEPGVEPDGARLHPVAGECPHLRPSRRPSAGDRPNP